MQTQVRRLRTAFGLSVESSRDIEHKRRLAAQVQHLVAAICDVYVRHQATSMRPLGRTAVDDVDGLSARAKAFGVLGQADQTQNFFDDAGADGLVLQALAEGLKAGEVLVVFIRLFAEHRVAKAAAPFGIVGDVGTLQATSVSEAEVCVEDWRTFLGELDDA